MFQIVLRHLVRTVLTVWALASVIFLLSARDAETAVRLAMPDAAVVTASTPTAQVEAQQAVRHRLGLDLPLFYVGHGPGDAAVWQWHGFQNQYHHWVARLVQGDLGTSFHSGQSVNSQLGSALQLTLPLTGTAAVLVVFAALALAQRMAARPRWYRPVRSVLVTLHTLPLFVLALALLLIFANPGVLAWFPAYGFDPASAQALGPGQRFLDYARHLALPVAALVIGVLPELTLQLESALDRELATDYATTARAKGLGLAATIHRHTLRNALLPTITQVAQLLPALVAGSVVVEVVFALPGMGRLLADAAAARDYPVLIGGVLLTGLVRVVALLLADLFYLWADPRIRWQS